MLKGRSLNSKIVTILGILVVSSITISALSLWRLGSIAESVDKLVDTYSKRVAHGRTMMAIVNDIRNQEKVVIIEESTEGMTKAIADLDALEKSLREEMAALETISTPEGVKQVRELAAYLDAWKPTSQRMRQLTLEGKNTEAMALARGPSREIFQNFTTVLKGVVERYTERMEQGNAETRALVRETTLIVLVLGVSSVLAGLLLAFFVLRAVNAAIDRVITSLSENAQQVASAASQIAATSEELSQSTTEQAASLQETASSIEEMSSMVQKNTENSKRAQALSGQNETDAGEGTRVVGELLRAMNDIDRSNEDILAQITRSNQQITDIVKVIAEIGNKTKVINDIVFQTKLLSFNASVEAARAGEHGKGFAVVAEEVGNLAQMSGNAAKEISAMLDGGIQKVEGIVHETKTRVEGLITAGKSKVAQGLDVAERCERVLQGISRGVSETAAMSQSIAAASDEQAKGIQEINRAVAQLDRVTQSNASAAEEASSSAEQLAAQSDTLQDAVRVLVETIWGHARAARHLGATGEAGSTPESVRSKKGRGGHGGHGGHGSRGTSLTSPARARTARPQMNPVKAVSEPAAPFDEALHGVPAADDERFESPAA